MNSSHPRKADMVRTSSTAASLIFVAVSTCISTEAFSPTISCVSRSSSILAVGVPDDVDDFDAPILADPVMSGKVGKLDHDPIVDDECYLGKDNSFDECVDFGETYTDHTFCCATSFHPQENSSNPTHTHLCPFSPLLLNFLVTDPMHNVQVATKVSDVDFKLPDFSKIGDEISSALKESIGKFINK